MSQKSVGQVVSTLSDNARLIIGAIEFCDGEASTREISSITGKTSKELYYYMNGEGSLEDKGIVDIDRSGGSQSPNVWSFTDFGQSVARQGGAADERALFDTVSFESEVDEEVFLEEFEEVKENMEKLQSQMNSILSLLHSDEVDADSVELPSSGGGSNDDVSMLQEDIAQLSEKVSSVEGDLQKVKQSLQSQDKRIKSNEADVAEVQSFLEELDGFLDDWTDWVEGELGVEKESDSEE